MSILNTGDERQLDLQFRLGYWKLRLLTHPANVALFVYQDISVAVSPAAAHIPSINCVKRLMPCGTLEGRDNTESACMSGSMHSVFHWISHNLGRETETSADTIESFNKLQPKSNRRIVSLQL